MDPNFFLFIFISIIHAYPLPTHTATMYTCSPQTISTPSRVELARLRKDAKQPSPRLTTIPDPLVQLKYLFDQNGYFSRKFVNACSLQDLRRKDPPPLDLSDIVNLKLHLPIQHAALESALLIESRSPKTDCLMGLSCIGKMNVIAGQGSCVFVKWMFSWEHKRWLESGKAPSKPRLCVLCARNNASCLIRTYRGMECPVPATHIYQSYSNLFGEKGEYKRQFSQFLRKDHEGFVSPPVKGAWDHLTWERSVVNHSLRWTIDQSKLIQE